MLRITLFLMAFLTGLFLIFYSPDSKNEARSGESLAETQSVTATVSVKLHGEYQFSPLHSGDKIPTLATVVSDNQGRARIKVKGQGLIELEPSTQAIFDESKDKKTVEIVVLNGHINVLQNGTLNSLKIFQREKRIQAESKSTNEPPGTLNQSQPLTTLPKDIVATEAVIPESIKPDQTLSSDYIRAVLEDQRRFVQSCYLKYFNARRGDVRIGRMLLNFIIEPSGKTKNVMVVKSDIDDQPFHDCIKSIFARTKFRSFQSAAIDMEYPIDIVLPE